MSHALIYVGKGKVAEANEDGVVVRPLSESLSDATLALAFRHSKLSKEQRETAALWAMSQKGKSYALGKVLSHPKFGPFKNLTVLDARLSGDFFCSELVFWALNGGGDSTSTNATALSLSTR